MPAVVLVIIIKLHGPHVCNVVRTHEKYSMEAVCRYLSLWHLLLAYLLFSLLMLPSWDFVSSLFKSNRMKLVSVDTLLLLKTTNGFMSVAGICPSEIPTLLVTQSIFKFKLVALQEFSSPDQAFLSLMPILFFAAMSLTKLTDYLTYEWLVANIMAGVRNQSKQLNTVKIPGFHPIFQATWTLVMGNGGWKCIPLLSSSQWPSA